MYTEKFCALCVRTGKAYFFGNIDKEKFFQKKERRNFLRRSVVLLTYCQAYAIPSL